MVRLAIGVVRWRESLAVRFVEHDPGIQHLQRTENARSQQFVIGAEAVATHEQLPEQALREVAVLVLAARFPSHAGLADRLEETCHREVRIRVVRVAAGHVGQARQPRRVRRKVPQQDRHVAERRHRDAVGQVLLHRIVEPDKATLHGIGEQQPREHLRHRADLVERVGARARLDRARHAAVAAHERGVAVDHAEHEANRDVRVDERTAEPIGLLGEWRCGFLCPGTREKERDEQERQGAHSRTKERARRDVQGRPRLGQDPLPSADHRRPPRATLVPRAAATLSARGIPCACPPPRSCCRPCC